VRGALVTQALPVWGPTVQVPTDGSRGQRTVSAKNPFAGRQNSPTAPSAVSAAHWQLDSLARQLRLRCNLF
jgi:hypothetical protein